MNEACTAEARAPAYKEGRIKAARIVLGTLCVIILILAGSTSVDTFIHCWEVRSDPVFEMEGVSFGLFIDEISATLLFILAVLAALTIPLAVFPTRAARIVAIISSILMWALFAFIGLLLFSLRSDPCLDGLQGFVSFIEDNLYGIAVFILLGSVPAAISVCVHCISKAIKQRSIAR